MKTELQFDEKYYNYLDGLRKSGITNMFGATPYLRAEFIELDKKKAKMILNSWMSTFSGRHKEGDKKK